MPNWCFNHVTFSGDKENLNKLTVALNKAKECEIKENKGQKIHSLDEVKDGYFFDIYFEIQNDFLILQYETRWSPNIEDVSELCREYKICASHEYEERGMQIYGTAIYNENGEYTDEQVEQKFLDLIEYDSENDMYVYNGEYWECEDDIIESEYPKWKESNF